MRADQSAPSPRDLDVLAAVARGEVTGQALHWYRGTADRVSCIVSRLQRRKLVADVDPPAAGRVVAETTADGRSALTAAGRCCLCGYEACHVGVCEHMLGGDPDDEATLDQSAREWWCGDPACPVQQLCGDCWSNL